MKNKTFRWVEMVVVLIVALFFIYVILPFLSSPKILAKQVQCSSQVSNIGKAIAMYQNEYNDSYPLVASPSNPNWQFGKTGAEVYNSDKELGDGGVGNGRWCDKDSPLLNWEKTPTLGGSLYLLCRYGDLYPKNFNCPSCKYSREMDQDFRAALIVNHNVVSYKDCFDLPSMNCCNYSYKNPCIGLPEGSSDLGTAILADKNWAFDDETGRNQINRQAGTCPDWNSSVTEVSVFIREADCTDRDGENEAHNNSQNHDTETQNVLFAGFNVERCDTPFVGIELDNIYTQWETNGESSLGKVKGRWGSGACDYGSLSGQDVKDSYLGN